MTPVGPEGSRLYRVLYASESIQGDPIAVSGMVALPPGEPPAEGWTSVTWAHGTKGVSDRCAPSRGYRTPEDNPNHDFYRIAPEILEAGWVAVSTDYEGLGTAGVHPYLVGESEARGAVDILRAATELPEVQLSGEFAAWGRSQGGHAALFVGQIAAEWAPELELVGVIAAAPAGEMRTVAGFAPLLEGSRGFFWQAMLGYDAAYPELEIEAIFRPEVVDTLEQLLDDEACDEEFGPIARMTHRAGLATLPTTQDEWNSRFDENSPGADDIPVPVLIIQGDADTVVPITLTQLSVERLCSAGVTLDYRVYEGQSHNDSSALHMDEFFAFTRARLAAEPATSTCPTP